MFDSRKKIVTELKKVGTTYYELDIKSPTFPCITYTIVDDSVNKEGDTLGYSNVIYQVKVWTTKVSELACLTKGIDNKLRAIGLKRTYYTEMTANDVIIGVMRYSGMVKEEFEQLI